MATAAPPGDSGVVVNASDRLVELYEEHFDFVWRNARRLGVPQSSAQDVVQEVFIVVQRRLPDFRGGPVRPWIFGILTRVVSDYRRAHRRKTARWVPLTPDLANGPETFPGSPSDLAERSERLRLLEALLEQLSEEQRTLIVLSELEQWTLRELAEYFGKNINTVYSRLRVAKTRFAEAYARACARPGDRP